MPNHVQNRIEIIGTKGQVEKVLNFIKGDDEVIDFDKIIPTPKALNISDSSEGHDGLEYLIGLGVGGIKTRQYLNSQHYKMMAKMKSENRKRFDAKIKVGKKYLSNILKYGHPTWYEWHIDKWGTKWNAYDSSLSDNFIEFQTAWNAPIPVVDRLASLFPEVELIHKWADEDTAYNCGERQYVNGKLHSEFSPNGGSKEAYELAFDLRPYIADDYELIDGNYRPKED